MKKKETHEVFGISNDILEDSYVNRSELDEELQRNLKRKNHIALRGESKCGKSWLRKRNIPNAIVVQCRFGTTVNDIYTDALSQLGIKLIIEESAKNSLKGKVEASVGFGSDLIAKILYKIGVEANAEDTVKGKVIGHDINDLRFISDLIKESGKKLVIEDFHYLSTDERQKLAFDLKALWDYGCFIVIIGVWSKSNLLIYLNQDLAGRIIEMPINWTPKDLEAVLLKGGAALNIDFLTRIKQLLIANCYKNAGLLQQLALKYLDEEKIFEEQDKTIAVDDPNYFESAALLHAEQLDTLYQQFAKDVSTGIRKRKDSTGIYAHAMAVIVDSSDDKLVDGLSLDEIFDKANKRQPRIQKGNLRSVLQKLEELQVDEAGRGLVIAFNDAVDEITAVDRQLLFYRKYVTVQWPWEEIIREIDSEESKVILSP